MSARSEHLTEEAGLLVCYGKQHREGDEDCESCEYKGDCESLTNLRNARNRPARVAKIPAARIRHEEEEEEEPEWNVPWAEPEEEEKPETTNPYQFATPQYSDPRYMVPMPPTPMQPYMPPGMHCNAQIVPHPAPHLTYMVANPIDCPMPVVGETWYSRIAKNVASGVLSEGGRQFYEFFRRFRF